MPQSAVDLILDLKIHFHFRILGCQVFSFIDDFCFSDIGNPLVDTPQKCTKRKRGPPVTPFLDAKPKAKKRKLDPPYQILKQTCKEHSVPFDIALGHLGTRFYHNVDPQLEQLFKW